MSKYILLALTIAAILCVVVCYPADKDLLNKKNETVPKANSTGPESQSDFFKWISDAKKRLSKAFDFQKSNKRDKRRIPEQAIDCGEKGLEIKRTDYSYCLCAPNNNYAFETCEKSYENPCSMSMKVTYAPVDVDFVPGDSLSSKKFFIHCSWNIPHLLICPYGTVWDADNFICNEDLGSIDYYRENFIIDESLVNSLASENQDANDLSANEPATDDSGDAGSRVVELSNKKLTNEDIEIPTLIQTNRLLIVPSNEDSDINSEKTLEEVERFLAAQAELSMEEEEITPPPSPPSTTTTATTTATTTEAETMAIAEEEKIAPPLEVTLKEIREEKIETNDIMLVCDGGVFFRPAEIGDYPFCICPGNKIGLTCDRAFKNKCGKEKSHGSYSAVDDDFTTNMDLNRSFFIQCDWEMPRLKKCARYTEWSNDIQTCVMKYY